MITACGVDAARNRIAACNIQRKASKIEVKVSGSTVTLKGRVDSWADRNVAQGAAYAAPGIGVVVNDLTVGATL